ncbi:hypothetical protein [[Scytonema hofmanni] UTEX B 1581]|nr:hypothetical protein [[Scytonema hofmanni] UTEX B 1581]
MNQLHHQNCVEALLLVARHGLFGKVAKCAIAFMILKREFTR